MLLHTCQHSVDVFAAEALFTPASIQPGRGLNADIAAYIASVCVIKRGRTYGVGPNQEQCVRCTGGKGGLLEGGGENVRIQQHWHHQPWVRCVTAHQHMQNMRAGRLPPATTGCARRSAYAWHAAGCWAYLLSRSCRQAFAPAGCAARLCVVCTLPPVVSHRTSEIEPCHHL